jgi:rSAM/selenodomain-associated transferase 2/rSAM/selenodomain-associated transferase 1
MQTNVKLSIIIPVLNEANDLLACLKPLQSWRQQGVELIVVDGGSDDDTLVLAREYADKAFVAARGRARQMNAGAKAATGRYLLFLHADTRLPQEGLDELLVRFESLQQHSAAWGFFPVRLSAQRWPLRVIERAMSWRSRLTSVATGDQAIFVARSLWDQLEGFADIPLMEDVELSKRLRRHSAPMIMPVAVETDSRRWESGGIVRTVLLMWSLRLLYVCGVKPQRLAPWYGIHPQPKQQTPCIAQLAKAPVLGNVKTRMQPQLSVEQSVELHQRLVQHVAGNLAQCSAACLQLWVSDQPDAPLFQSLQQRYPLDIHVQRAGDLGQRMYHICHTVLQQYGAVILVGSDCPFITPRQLDQVLVALEEGNQAVIIPAQDGGYTLLALTQAEWRIFDGVEWGGERVYRQTLERLQQLGWRYHCMEPLADIDRPEDLALLHEDAATRAIAEDLGAASGVGSVATLT